MNDESRGLRSLPPALLFAFALSMSMIAARLIFMLTAKEPWGAVRFNLASDGIGYASEVLALLGSFELARRLSGQAALGMRIVAWGFTAVLAVDIQWSLLGFMDKMWEHETLLKAVEYTYYGAWLAVPVGLCIALWREKRELGIFIVVVSLLTWPPPFIAKQMYSWLPSGNSGFAIDAGFRFVRYAFLLAGLVAIARGTTVSDRATAASGLRLAAKSLWLRLIAAMAVPLITLMVIGGKGSKGSLEMLKLATFVALLVNIISFAQFGVGALRAARASVTDLGRWSLVLGGACSLWASGVMMGQLPWLYKLLYKADSSSSFGGGGTEYAQALSIALPLVVTTGMGLIAVAIAGLAARTGNEELRAHAQAKGAGFVALSLVAMAISAWMLPKADSMSSLAMLLLLTLGAAVTAIVMMAKLLGLAADALDRDPGLPTASVIQ
jgi:hypothetical protein